MWPAPPDALGDEHFRDNRAILAIGIAVNIRQQLPDLFFELRANLSVGPSIDVIGVLPQVRWDVIGSLGDEDRSVLQRVADAEFIEDVGVSVGQVSEHHPRGVEILHDAREQVSSSCRRSTAGVTALFHNRTKALFEDFGPLILGC